MNRRLRLTIWGFLLFTQLAPLRPVNACATAVRLDARLEIASEEAIIVWNASTHTEHFVRTANFETDAKDFGFLVPTPTVPTLAAVDKHVFGSAEPPILDTLYDQTAPKVIEKEHQAWRFVSWLFPQFDDFMHREDAMVAATSPVSVLATQQVAGLDATTLEAANPAALVTWLSDHGYPASPSLTAWLAPYVAKHWKITAFKIAKQSPDQSDISSALVSMTFKTDKPFFPYSEPANQRDASHTNTFNPRMLRVYVFSNTRMDAAIGPNTENAKWPGETIWANQMQLDQLSHASNKLGLNSNEMPLGMWLTRFDDASSPRPGVADLFFTPEATPSAITPPAIIHDQEIPRGFPIEVMILPIGIGLIIWSIRRKRRRAVRQTG